MRGLAARTIREFHTALPPLASLHDQDWAEPHRSTWHKGVGTRPQTGVVSRVSTKTGMGTSGHPGRGSPQVASGTSHGRHGPPQPVAAPSNRLDHSTVPSWMQVEARISRISPLPNPFRFRWSQHLEIPVLPFLRPSCIPVSSRYSTPLHAAAHFCHRG